MCVIHKEKNKMFCEEEKPLLYLLCSSSQEHRAQELSSVEGAAEEYQVSEWDSSGIIIKMRILMMIALFFTASYTISIKEEAK